MSRASINRRALLLNTVLAFVFVLSASTGAATTGSLMTQCRFEPDGYFYIKGASPKDFEIDHIQLVVTDKGARKPQTSESVLLVRSGRNYRFSKLREFETHSSGKGITFEFETEIIEGVNYQFSGKFDSICNLAEDEHDPEKVVAVGHMRKFKDGNETAAAEVELTYSKTPRGQILTSRPDNSAATPAGHGREVLAIISKMELKAYTDELSDGKVLVSDIIRFEVVDPKTLRNVTVTAYYQGVPEIGGRRLKVGDLMYFELPAEPQRYGILLWDLKGFRFRD